MFYGIRVSLLALALLLAAPAALATKKTSVPLEPEKEVRVVAVGSIDRLYPEAAEPRLEVGNKTVIEVQPYPESKELRIIPLKKGETTLTIFNLAGRPSRVIRYQVITNDQLHKLESIRYLIRNIPGVTATLVDEVIVFEGKPKKKDDGDKLLRIQAFYSDLILNLAVDDTGLCQKHLCQKRMEDQELPELVLEELNKTVEPESLASLEPYKELEPSKEAPEPVFPAAHLLPAPNEEELFGYLALPAWPGWRCANYKDGRKKSAWYIEQAGKNSAVIFEGTCTDWKDGLSPRLGKKK